METEILCAGCGCDLCDMRPEEAVQQDGVIFYKESPVGPIREPVRKGSFLCDYCQARYHPTAYGILDAAGKVWAWTSTK